MRYELLFRPRFLCAAHIAENPSLSLVVAGTREETAYDQQTRQNKPVPVLFFSSDHPGLILNKTNGRFLAEALGHDTDDWLGATVTFRVATVQVGKNLVDCVRIATAKKAPQAKKPREPQEKRSRVVMSE